MKDFFKNITIAVIFPVLVSLGTFLITKRQYDTAVQGNELKNIQEAIIIYKNMAFDLNEKVQSQTQRISELEFTVEELKRNCP